MLDEAVLLRAALLGQAAAQVGLGPLHRPIEQVAQAHGVAGAGLEFLAVVPLHQTEGHVLHPHPLADPAGAAGHLEHPGEVGRLAGIGDVDQPAGAIA